MNIFLMQLSSDFLASVVFNAIFLDATHFGFVGVNFRSRHLFDATIFGFWDVNFVQGSVFGCQYLRVLWCQLCSMQFSWMPLSSDFLRSSLVNAFFWCHYLRFFGVSFVQGSFFAGLIIGFFNFSVLVLSGAFFFRCHYLRILWCSFCTRQFCWCHYLRFFGVNFVQGMSFLMPLSSEKLVSFFVQGAFVMPLSLGFWC